jgi:antitoxin component YwqK of YwqJK toxin-antitoxin module
MKSLVFNINLILLMQCFITATSCQNSNTQPQSLHELVNLTLLRTNQGITYNNGNPFTGKAFALDTKRDTIALDIYFHGKLHGESKAWYSYGKIMEERWYRNGRKEGLHQAWWPNGHLKFQYEFKEDEYNGQVKEWYENGVLFKHFTYELGHEEGPQKMWRIDGSVYANYVVKKNRIYGLSGRKNCKNLWKSQNH